MFNLYLSQKNRDIIRANNILLWNWRKVRIIAQLVTKAQPQEVDI